MSYGDSEASTYDGPAEAPMREDRELARSVLLRVTRRIEL